MATVPGPGSAAGGGVPQAGGVMGPDGTFYVGGADSMAPGSVPIGQNGGGASLPQFGSQWPTQFTMPPPTPPEAPAHPALPNPDQTYVDQFMASIGRQRQGIDNQLAASTQQLGARRDAAAAVVAGLPANFNAHFASAKANSALENHVAKGSAKGNDQSLGADANNQLARATLENTNAAAQSTVPLMNLGVTANYGAGLDTLNAAKTSADAAIDAQQSGFYANMAGAAAGYAHADAAQKDSEAFSSSERKDQNAWDAAHNPKLANGGVSADFAADPGNQVINLPGYGPTTVTQAEKLVKGDKYSSLENYGFVSQHGPTVANAIQHAVAKGDLKEAQRIWGTMSPAPDMKNYLWRNYGISTATVGITAP